MNVAFADALKTWGPQATPRGLSRSAAEAYCRTLARTHYENFPVVSWLLPRHLHQPFYNVYAYCRWADDLGDEIADARQATELLEWWRDQLRACYHGSATHPVFIALGPSIEEFGIPQQPFEDLLSAFKQDQRVKRYESYAELRDYCRRSADPVGRIVLYLCGAFSDRNAAWSDSICTGLQLANFWQDVARDLDIGRVYLPRESLLRFGYSDADLANRVTNEPFLKVMEFEVDRSRQLLKSGLPLVTVMPWPMRVDIDLFARGGLCLLDRIERIGYRVWQNRPVLTKIDFARLFIGSLGRGLFRLPRRPAI
jgi:squalene synthase HpnC